jgi:GNAT superfamily N-acetyltransferase
MTLPTGHGLSVPIELTDEPEQMPPPAEVEALLAAASSRLGADEAAILAQASARMYSWARSIPGALTAATHDHGELVGFGYGYSWDWTTMTDPWSLRLRDRLGRSASVLDESFSVVLLVVAPDHRRGGMGAQLLKGLAEQADEPCTWLQTGAASPMRRLCEAVGWQPLDAAADPVVMLSG